MRPSAPNDPPQDAPRDRNSSDASTARALRASAIALSSANASERVAAAESLLELDIGPEARGAEWALALCAAGVVVPLLRSVQLVRRDASTAAPAEDESEDVVAAGDAALLALSELGGVANGLLENEGYQLELDEESGQALFVDSRSGMASATVPRLRAQEDADAEDAWAFGALLETLTSVTPLGVNERTGALAWSVEVVDHVCEREEEDRPAVSVLDMAVEDGSVGERARALVVSAWRGSDGPVEAEKDPHEPLGVALDSWRDATYVATAMMASSSPSPRVLMTSCAAGATPSFLRAYWPSARVDVVESNGVVVDFAMKHFGFECTRCDDLEDVATPGDAGDVRVWRRDFAAVAAAAPRDRYDVVIGRWPNGDARDVWDALCAIITDDGVMAFSSATPEALEMMETRRAAVLRDAADATRDDVETRPDKRARESLSSKLRPDDIACVLPASSSSTERAFDPNEWDERVVGKLGGADAARFPYRLASRDERAGVTVLEYAAAEIEDVTPAKDDRNAAWDAFGDADADPCSSSPNVFDAAYWNGVLAAHGCSVADGGDLGVGVAAVDASETRKHVRSLEDDGYVWGDVVVPREDVDALRRGVDALVAASWPPACVFVSDVAWRVIDRLFAHAEVLLGGECVLEPSVAAFKLEKCASGKRYIGNNFGVPHRDYSLDDAVGEDGTRVLSLWLPLNRVTETNGCMYIVSKKHDRDGGRTDAAKSAPEVPRGAAAPLAPVQPGALLAWAGNIIHWGSACHPDSPDDPRSSVAFVFRKRGVAESRADARCAPLDRAAAAATTLARRLEIIHHAIGVFEHWYGDAKDVRDKLR